MNAAAHKDASPRAARSREALRSCKLCPRECGVDRTSGEKGYCGLDDSTPFFREMLIHADEQELTPSHHVYMAGCNLSCGFCALAEWNEHPDIAGKLDVEALVKKIVEREAQGARNLHIIGGEPSVNLHGALELLAQISADKNVVWNSNMYFGPLAGELLTGLVDIYLADFKCGNSRCARELLDAEDYVEIAQGNLRMAYQTTGLIVRHLVLPGHEQCCLKPVLRWLAIEIPKAKVSLRGDYVPPAEHGAAPGGYLSPEEFKTALDFAASLGLNVIK